jgi:diguanylate cyclase
MIEGRLPEAVLGLGAKALGSLMPMYLWLGPGGDIRGAGPTLDKLCGEWPLKGCHFAEHFRLSRMRTRPGTLRLQDMVGHRLHLGLRLHPTTTLRGLAVPVGAGRPEEGIFLNLSFGIGLADAVRDHGLTAADFAPSDLAMELLYLQEAKAAIMAELRGLNERLEGARRAAEARAQTDPLTGLANRRALDLALDRSIAALGQGGAPFAVAHLDLDHFKAVNDSLGHAAGDHVLGRVARILTEETRRHDLVARMGGDEFVLLLRGTVDPASLRALGARIIERLEEPSEFEGQLCRISGSLGVALSTSYAVPEAERMLSDADGALYASKRRGRARCTVLVPGEEQALGKRHGDP